MFALVSQSACRKPCPNVCRAPTRVCGVAGCLRRCDSPPHVNPGLRRVGVCGLDFWRLFERARSVHSRSVKGCQPRSTSFDSFNATLFPTLTCVTSVGRRILGILVTDPVLLLQELVECGESRTSVAAHRHSFICRLACLAMTMPGRRWMTESSSQMRKIDMRYGKKAWLYANSNDRLPINIAPILISMVAPKVSLPREQC